MFGSVRIARTPRSDYRWRVSVHREDVADKMSDRVESNDYDNFKNSVDEKELHDMYALWWGDHVKYQRG